MEAEVSAACEALRSTDWTERVRGLQLVATLAASFTAAPADARRGVFVALRGEAVDLVKTQLKDLRSSVASEAARCAGVCGGSLGVEHCGALGESWLVQLLAMLSGTAPKVVQSAADAAARQLVVGCGGRGSSGIAQRLMKMAVAKAPPVRRCSLEYLCLALAEWDGSAIESSLSKLGSVIVAKSRDADAGVRQAAREAWWALQDAGLAREASATHELFDAATRKQLGREAKTRKPSVASVARVDCGVRPATAPTHGTRVVENGRAVVVVRDKHLLHRSAPLVSCCVPPACCANEKDDDWEGELDEALTAQRRAAASMALRASHTLDQRTSAVPVPIDDADCDDSYDCDADCADLGPVHTSSQQPVRSPSPVQPKSASLSAETLEELVQQAASPHWDLRRDAIAALRRTLSGREEACEDSSEEDALRARAWLLVASAAADSHHQVVSAALDVAQRGLRALGCDGAAHCAALAQPFKELHAFGKAPCAGCSVLGALLAHSARRLVDARKTLSTAASAVLDAARSGVATSSLLRALAPCSAELRPLKARATLLEFATSLLRTDEGFCSDTGAVGDLARKLCSTLECTLDGLPAIPGGGFGGVGCDERAALFAAAARCANALRRAAPATFVGKVATFAPEPFCARRLAVGTRDLLKI